MEGALQQDLARSCLLACKGVTNLSYKGLDFELDGL